MKKKMQISSKKVDKVAPYVLLIPAMTLFTLFSFWPFLKSFYLAMTVTNKKGEAVKWVGLENFIRVFTSGDFKLVMQNTFVFAAVVGVFTFVIAMCLALLCVEKRRFSRVYEVMYSIPMAIAAAPAAALWLFMFKQGGVLDMLLGQNYPWLTDGKFAIYSVAAATVWLHIGSSFLFLLVGFRNVPEDLLESARIDGAGRLTRIFKIMFPIASPQIFFVVFLNITGSFKAFGEIRLLTGGGPAKATTTLVYAIYEQAMKNGRFETACVYSICLFLVIFLVTRIQLLVEKRVVFYD